MDAIQEAGHAGKVNIAMDVAASEMYTEDGKVRYAPHTCSGSDLDAPTHLCVGCRSIT